MEKGPSYLQFMIVEHFATRYFSQMTPYEKTIRWINAFWLHGTSATDGLLHSWKCFHYTRAGCFSQCKVRIVLTGRNPYFENNGADFVFMPRRLTVWNVFRRWFQCFVEMENKYRSLCSCWTRKLATKPLRARWKCIRWKQNYLSPIRIYCTLAQRYYNMVFRVSLSRRANICKIGYLSVVQRSDCIIPWKSRHKRIYTHFAILYQIHDGCDRISRDDNIPVSQSFYFLTCTRLTKGLDKSLYFRKIHF